MKEVAQPIAISIVIIYLFGVGYKITQNRRVKDIHYVSPDGISAGNLKLVNPWLSWMAGNPSNTFSGN